MCRYVKGVWQQTQRALMFDIIECAWVAKEFLILSEAKI